MRYIKNPVAQFLAAGIVVLVVVVVVTLQLSGRAADSEAINDARSTTELLARSVAQPAIPRGLADGDPGAVDRFDRTALSRLLVGNVQRIKIWTADGRIVYSDETRLIGDTFPLGDDEREVLDEGDQRRRALRPRRAGEPVRAEGPVPAGGLHPAGLPGG